VFCRPPRGRGAPGRVPVSTTARQNDSRDESHRTHERTVDGDVAVDGGHEAGEAPARSTCPDRVGRVVTSDAETVCTDCGLVIADQQIDHGPEWRYADETDEVSAGRARPGPRRATATA